MDRVKLKPWQQVTLLWLAWALILNGCQAFLARRLAFVRPDPVLDWTAQFTSQDFLDSLPAQGGFWKLYSNPHVAWDSNYYLSIAAAGYDDPHMPTVQVRSGENLSRSYAFPPLYPLLVRLAAAPIGVVLPPQPALLWAGVLVSLLGALAGAIALAEMAGMFAGDGLRAAFYLLIFPTAFFLSQVYTEGLFVGLAFGCLALVARRHWLGAALLATAACFTRTAGVGLIITMAAVMAQDAWRSWRSGERRLQPLLLPLAWLLLPLVALALWQISPLGQRFFAVQESYFNRSTLALSESWMNWSQAARGWISGALPPARQAYFSLEFCSVILALIASLATLRRYPAAALYSLFVLITAVTSGYPQSMVRYMLTVPAIYLWLATLGRRPVFDRAWTLASILLMGALLALFTFDMWVG